MDKGDDWAYDSYYPVSTLMGTDYDASCASRNLSHIYVKILVKHVKIVHSRKTTPYKIHSGKWVDKFLSNVGLCTTAKHTKQNSDASYSID